MLHEYAIDPNCLRDWQSFKILIGAFGVSQGRLVSQFPKDWIKRVHDSCGSFSFVQQQKKEIELDRIKKFAMTRSGRNYDGSKIWIENALQQQKDKPFAAVLTKDSSPDSACILAVDEIFPHTPLWSVERELKVPRTVYAMSEEVAPLLRISERILFVDKMFHPASERWRNMLKSFMLIASEGRDKPPLFEYHCGVEKDKKTKNPQQDEISFHADCQLHLKPILPFGGSIIITRWEQKKRGDFFHDRYVLTDKGGVRIGWGLDTGKQGETTDVCLLSDTMHSQRWSEFQPDFSPYTFIDTVKITRD